MSITDKIRDELRQRAKRDGLRGIGRACGVDSSQLSRFMRAERQLTTGANLDSLACYLGLELKKRRGGRDA